MIRIDRGNEVSPGVWAYTVRGLSVSGKSRQPLLDACRQIKRMGGDTATLAGVFHEGSKVPTLTCIVEKGAELTVNEGQHQGPKFRKFQPFGGIKMGEI